MKSKVKPSNTDQGQVTLAAAKVYEEFFIPALFQEWAARVMEAAKISKGDSVLDVGCGTGILARTIAKHITAGGKLVGLDLNEGMLRVAAQINPEIDYRLGSAESLPFPDESFDAVVSQFSLMFFTDRPKALKEMMRVLKPQGHFAVAVWDSLENNPGYQALINLLQQLFGDQAADPLRSPFALGNTQRLIELFEQAGLPSPYINTIQGVARFPSIRTWVYTEIKGWTISEMLNDQQFEELLTKAETTLHSFLKPDGTVSFAMPAHIVTAKKVNRGLQKGQS